MGTSRGAGDLFATEALSQIPKILTLLDRNRHSPTYGCFDRNLWHYKIIDFPSGMAQEFVLPLALAYDLDIEGNAYYRKDSLREWARAGILYAAKTRHGDGSCDDYFPFERAGGATAFSLLACLDAYEILGFDDEDMRRFFDHRADWLAHHHESGQLANHQALIALCLKLAARILKTSKWDRLAEERLSKVLSWQHQEGWFQEYEGCDPGYHTLTVSLLSRLYDLEPSDALKDAITRAVRFASHFVHPDGSYGGEYASRNTYNFFPHGFELAAKWLPEASTVNDRFLNGLKAGLGPCYADDHIIGHHTWNYLLAWRDFHGDRMPVPSPPSGRTYFEGAKLLIERRGDHTLYIALNKGGVFKAFKGDLHNVSDTQISLKTKEGKTAVGHLVGPYDVSLTEDEIVVSGPMGWAKQTQMTTFKLMALRGFMMTVGRYFSDLVRKLIQKILITGKSDTPFSFERRFKWNGTDWEILDTVRATSWDDVDDAALGCDQTSIYVVMSRTYQPAQLQGWRDLTDKVRVLKTGENLTINRAL